LNRIQNYFIEEGNGFIGTPFKRAFMKDVTPYIGGQWKVLTRYCCEFITYNRKVAAFKRYYKNTLIADEGFFQTVLMNTSYNQTIIDNDMREIVWIPDIDTRLIKNNLSQSETTSLVASGKIKLRPKTFTMQDQHLLLKSDALFARKFDESVDADILQILENSISNQPLILERPMIDSTIPRLLTRHATQVLPIL
jgi:hypothetical protein